MFVDPELLRSGAKDTHRAGGHAQDGADHLARGPLVSAMFGDFAAADGFHAAVTSAHDRHVKILQAQQETLSAIGTRAHCAATEFTRMDEHNADQLRAVRGTPATWGPVQ